MATGLREGKSLNSNKSCRGMGSDWLFLPKTLYMFSAQRPNEVIGPMIMIFGYRVFVVPNNIRFGCLMFNAK